MGERYLLGDVSGDFGGGFLAFLADRLEILADSVAGLAQAVAGFFSILAYNASDVARGVARLLHALLDILRRASRLPVHNLRASAHGRFAGLPNLVQILAHALARFLHSLPARVHGVTRLVGDCSR